MSVSLRTFGIKLNKRNLQREILMVGGKGRISGELGLALKILDDDVLAFILGLARDIYVNGKINRTQWNRVKLRVLNTRIHTPYNKFDKRFSQVTNKFQKLAFRETSFAMKNTFKKLYPSKQVTITQKEYRKNLQELQFMDNELELKFLKTGREVVEESAYLDEMFRHKKLLDIREVGLPEHADEWGRKAVKEISKVLVSEYSAHAIKSINIGIGTGDINKDFLMFLERQLQV